MIKVFIADNHPIIRSCIEQILSDPDDIQIVASEGNDQNTIKNILTTDCDVVLLDISMADLSGAAGLAKLVRLKSELPVLLLSHNREEEYAIRAIKAGASGYLRTIHAPEELEIAIRKVSRGGIYFASRLVEEFALANMQVKSMLK
jgi:two-component system, NarL family, invasion response regulator UvrY